MANEAMTEYRARQKAAGRTEKRVWCTDQELPKIHEFLEATRTGRPIPSATQAPTVTANPFTLDLTTKSWRVLAPHLRPEQIAYLESKEAKPCLSVPSHRPITEGMFGPQMLIMWYPASVMYQALTYCYENFMEYYESMKLKLHLAEPNSNWRGAALQIGVRPHIAPVPLPNLIYIPPEGAELPDPPDSWYKDIGLKPPKTNNHQPTPAPSPSVQETTTQTVNTAPTPVPTPNQIVPDPWSDMPVFS